jgi:hypothetical protein
MRLPTMRRQAERRGRGRGRKRTCLGRLHEDGHARKSIHNWKPAVSIDGTEALYRVTRSHYSESILYVLETDHAAYRAFL